MALVQRRFAHHQEQGATIMPRVISPKFIFEYIGAWVCVRVLKDLIVVGSQGRYLPDV
jgi:IMP cyclohydrolase